jgi:uncharacterized membrane protein
MSYVVAVGRSFSKSVSVPVGLVFQPLLACFLILVGFVAVVSVHDAALLIVNQDNILEYEKNPIGYWLIQANSGSVWLFVVVKLLGTSLVCAVLASIYEHSQSLALVITGPLAIFQAVLLSYLYSN